MAFDARFKGKLYIQCTWAAVYMQPVNNKGILMRSYSRSLMSKLFHQNQYVTKKFRSTIVNQRVIGISTGNYIVDERGVKWIEAYPMYCDRAELHNKGIGWFRDSDIWYSNKGTIPNKLDWEFIPYRAAGNPGNGNGNDTAVTVENNNKNSWLAWLTGGIALLKIFG